MFLFVLGLLICHCETISVQKLPDLRAPIQRMGMFLLHLEILQHHVFCLVQVTDVTRMQIFQAVQLSFEPLSIASLTKLQRREKRRKQRDEL